MTPEAPGSYGLCDPALLVHGDEQRGRNAQLMDVTQKMAGIDTRSVDGLRWLREAMAPGGLFGMQALDFPETLRDPRSRLRAARTDVELDVYPEGRHRIDAEPTGMGRVARERIHAFLRGCLTRVRAAPSG